MTLKKWGHNPKYWGHKLIFTGSWRRQVVGSSLDLVVSHGPLMSDDWNDLRTGQTNRFPCRHADHHLSHNQNVDDG